MAPTPGKSLRRRCGLLVGIVARHGRFLFQWSCEGGVCLSQGGMVCCKWQARHLFSGQGNHCCDEMITAAMESHNACCMRKNFGSVVPSGGCIFLPRHASYCGAAGPCIDGRAAGLRTKLFGGSCPAARVVRFHPRAAVGILALPAMLVPTYATYAILGMQPPNAARHPLPCIHVSVSPSVCFPSSFSPAEANPPATTPHGGSGGARTVWQPSSEGTSKNQLRCPVLG